MSKLLQNSKFKNHVGMNLLFKILNYEPSKRIPPIKNGYLVESACSLAHKIRNQEISSVELMNAYVERISQVNPILNCVVAQRYEAAMSEAVAADELVRSKKFTKEQIATEKPLLGVPFTTKDCIAVKDMIHSSGVYRRRHYIAKEDAEAIRNIRKAGAIPIALTNVSELCMWWESNNPVHGRTLNPYDTNHIAGGSSGGEGCTQAVAASAFGVASDLGGSIRMPAFFNGIFGLKPSQSIVPNKGQHPGPESPEQDMYYAIGPICRRAEDLAPILKALAGDKAKILNLDKPVDIKGIKIYYQESDMGSKIVTPVDPQITDVMRKVVRHFEKAYEIKATKSKNPRFKKSVDIWLASIKVKNGPTFEQKLANYEGSINAYLELFKWMFKKSPHTLSSLITCLVEKTGIKYGSVEYYELIRQKDLLVLELSSLLGQDGVLFYPTYPTPAPFHSEPIFKPLNFAYTAIINTTGFPACHIPLGLSREGLPIGIQVISNVNQDRLCIAVAMELEKAFGGWIQPSIQKLVPQ